MPKRELKVHYAYSDNESPPGASYCTPKTSRKQVTEDPKKVTCRLCRVWAEADAKDEAFWEEAKSQPWYQGLFQRNRDRRVHRIITELIGLADALVTFLTLGNFSSGLQLGYILCDLRKQAEVAERDAEQSE